MSGPAFFYELKHLASNLDKVCTDVTFYAVKQHQLLNTSEKMALIELMCGQHWIRGDSVWNRLVRELDTQEPNTDFIKEEDGTLLYFDYDKMLQAIKDHTNKYPGTIFPADENGRIGFVYTSGNEKDEQACCWNISLSDVKKSMDKMDPEKKKLYERIDSMHMNRVVMSIALSGDRIRRSFDTFKETFENIEEYLVENPGTISVEKYDHTVNNSTIKLVQHPTNTTWTIDPVKPDVFNGLPPSMVNLLKKKLITEDSLQTLLNEMFTKS